MRLQHFFPVLLASLALTAQAQNLSRQASIRGGGNPNEGKCTVEVVVDGAAQVEIRGATAQIVNQKGQPPQWRRFECTSPMPANPEGFRFAGVDGRGRQQLVREPRNGSPAVIEIEDPDNGSEGYTFDIFWGSRQNTDNRGGYQQQPNFPAPQPGYGQGRGNGNGYGNVNGNFGTQQAISVCEENIRQQASERYRTNNVAFRQTRIDDNPGRNDWVIGTVEVRNPYRGGDQLMRFSCSVDFRSGRVRTATLEPAGAISGPGPQGRGVAEVNPRAIQNCERAAQQRVASQGFQRSELGTSRFDTDRGPRVVGDLRAYGRNGAESFRFSCEVDPRDGDVRNVEVFPRDERR